MITMTFSAILFTAKTNQEMLMRSADIHFHNDDAQYLVDSNELSICIKIMIEVKLVIW